MRALTHICRIASVAALAALLAAPVAQAAPLEATALEATFAGMDGWTVSSSCAPLCTVTNMVDGSAGASEPGAATVVYTTLGGLLGGLASGTSTWTSPSFTWTHATPQSAALSLARRSAISSLLSVGGSASSRFQLRDLTTGITSLIDAEPLATAEGSFVAHAIEVDPALLLAGHSYRVLITTSFFAAALLSDIRVAYDDVRLTGTSETGGSTGGTSGGTTPAAPAGSAPVATIPGGHGSSAQLQLAAPRVVRFVPGRAVTLRVRATRAGKAARQVVVTLLIGTTSRRISTGRDGYASIRLRRRAHSALRITFRVGDVTATTWARPRHAPGGSA